MHHINSLKTILFSITDKYKLDDDQKFLNFYKQWHDTMPQQIKNAVKPLKLKADLLYVSVLNNTWRQIILADKQKFVKMINTKIQKDLQDIIIEEKA